MQLRLPSYDVTLFIAVLSTTLLLTQRALEFKQEKKRRKTAERAAADADDADCDTDYTDKHEYTSLLSTRGSRALQPMIS